MAKNELVIQTWNWVKEFVKRLKTTTPSFYKVFIGIGAFCAVLPNIVQEARALNLIPAKFNDEVELALRVAGVVLMVISRTVSYQTTLGLTKSGNVIKTIDDKKLPFTARSEQKRAVKCHEPTITDITMEEKPTSES